VDNLLAPIAIVYVFPFKLYVGPALVIALAASLALLVRFPALKGKVGSVLIALGVVEAYGCVTMAFFEGFLIGLATVSAGIMLDVSALQPERAILLSKRKKFPLKAALAVILLVFGTGIVFAGFSFGSPGMIFSGLAVLVVGSIVGVNVLSSWARMQLRLKMPATLKKTAYLVLALVVAVSGALMTLRVTNLIHEQRLETWSGTTVNLTIQGVVANVKLNYEVNTGYSYHIFPVYFTLNVTKVLWVGPSEFCGNLANAVEYWSNTTVVVACDKQAPQGLAVRQTVEVNGYFGTWMEDSIYSGMMIVAPTMSEGYVTLL
jgi:hypothetical protein